MSNRCVDHVTALAELAEQVRQGTLQLLLAPKPRWLTWSPVGTSNHILWHAGHALWLQDVLTIVPLTDQSELPASWEDTFGQHCRPVSTTADWPDAQTVGGHLSAQLNRILNLLNERAEEIITSADRRPPRGGWPLLAGMIHGWHDEARHQGEMYLLYKLCQIGSGQFE